MTKAEFIKQYDDTAGNTERAVFVAGLINKMVHLSKFMKYDYVQLVKDTTNRPGKSVYEKLPEWYRKRLRHIKYA